MQYLFKVNYLFKNINMSNNLIPVTTRLDEELYHQIKVMAVINNSSVQELIGIFIKEGLEKLKSNKND